MDGGNTREQIAGTKAARPAEHEWKVRNMPTSDSAAAVEAAGRADQTTAEWLSEAIREKILRERGVDHHVLEPELPERQRVTPREMAEIAAIAGLPRWVRSGAAKLVGDALGITRPTPPPRRPRLNGPNHPNDQDIS